MAKLSPSDLRRQRQQRLASSNVAREEREEPKAASKPVVRTAALESREIVARVADPARLSADTQVSMSGPYNHDTDNPHWIVVANGEPLAKIALADQQEPDKIRKIFANGDYATAFLDTCKKVPLLQVLVTLNAKPYVAAVKTASAFEDLKSVALDGAKKSFQERSARYRDDFASMLSLVCEAQRKNYLNQNPLKDAFFKNMKAAGVQDPVRVIEAAFQEAGTAHYEMLFTQAQKWMDYAPVALADIKQEILNMPVREVTASVSQEPVRQAHIPSSRANVPIVASMSSGDVQPVTAKDEVKKILSFRTRLHTSMSPRG